jgi:hypothetical protein
LNVGFRKSTASYKQIFRSLGTYSRLRIKIVDL